MPSLCTGSAHMHHYNQYRTQLKVADSATMGLIPDHWTYTGTSEWCFLLNIKLGAINNHWERLTLRPFYLQGSRSGREKKWGMCAWYYESLLTQGGHTSSSSKRAINIWPCDRHMHIWVMLRVFQAAQSKRKKTKNKNRALQIFL